MPYKAMCRCAISDVTTESSYALDSRWSYDWLFKRVKDVFAGHHASAPKAKGITAQLNNMMSPTECEALVDKFDVGAFFKYRTDENDSDIGLGGGKEATYTFYNAGEKIEECPRISVKGEEKVSAILDTGCELTLKNKNLYDKTKRRHI